jgi:hypothetical protein
MDFDMPKADQYKVIEDVAGKRPEDVQSTLIFTRDTLDLATLIAEDVFGSKAAPEIAILIFDRIIGLLASVDSEASKKRELERVKEEAEASGWMEKMNQEETLADLMRKHANKPEETT